MGLLTLKDCRILQDLGHEQKKKCGELGLLN